MQFILLRDESISSGLSGGVDATSLINQDTIDNINRALDNFELLVAAPGAVAAAVLLIAVIFSCLASRGVKGCCYCMSKIFILLGIILCSVALVFFAILAGAGIAAGTDSAKDSWDENIGRTCRDTSAEISNQLASATADVTLCVATLGASSCSSANAALNSATLQSNYFDNMCTCISETLNKLTPLAAPGAVGTIACLLGLIMSMGLCCTMSCCGSASKKVAPQA